MSLTESTPFTHPTLIEAVTRQQYPAGTFYVVATPIGNIADISLRALHLLSLADAIACEDTRNTAQLLSRYGIQKPLIAAHQHNEREVAGKILQRLQAGERIALVSDAGTPGVSDPGAKIVNELKAAGIPVTPLPGASAAVSALSASGLLDEHFYFAGFLPSKAGQRAAILQQLESMQASLIFYEAPHRIEESVQAMLETFGGERRIVFARELSKLFEEIHRCPLAQASGWLAADPHRLKGEYVLIIEGKAQAEQADQLEARRVLQILLQECPLKQAASLAAQLTGQKKNALYQLALSMKSEAGEEE